MIQISTKIRRKTCKNVIFNNSIGIILFQINAVKLEHAKTKDRE